jgi:tRNA(Ile)-lysidine synthase
MPEKALLNTSLLTGDLPLGIAVSGGSDSLALLILCAGRLGAENLRAATVDHGLRTAAADEAAEVAKLCAQLGTPHQTLNIDLAKGPNVQARGRTARYAALATWAQDQRISAVALGHTRDDVAESFVMRLARGSGVDGLAQMPETFTRDGTLFLRPLLNAQRHDLQTLLTERGIPWASDPTNTDPSYTRSRIRNANAELAALGLTPDRLAQTAQWMQAAREVLESAAETWITRHARHDHGDAILDPAALNAAPKETAHRVTARILCNISGNPYRPRNAALGQTLATVEQGRAVTLHGCLLYLHRGKLRITREAQAAQAAQPTQAGAPEWDNRWTISGPLKSQFHIAALTQSGLNQLDNWRDTALLPRQSLLASPAIWQGETLVAAPLAQPHPDWQAAARNPLHLSK